MLLYNDNERKELVPSGSYNAVCTNVHDLGIQPGYKDGGPRRKIVLVFEVDKTITSGSLTGQRHRVSDIVAVNFYEKSSLVKLLTSWYGYNPVAKASDGTVAFNTDELLGRPATLTISHTERAGKTQATITSVAQHMAGCPVLQPPTTPPDVPDWVKRLQDQAIRPPTNGTPAEKSPVQPPATDAAASAPEEVEGF